MRRSYLGASSATFSAAYSATIFAALFATFFIAGCASFTSAESSLEPQITTQITASKKPEFSRQGRIAIRVASLGSESPQSVSGAFVINGDAQNGDLSLSTPLGSKLAELSWTPQQATLIANNENRRFATTDELMQEVTGTTLPVAALFEWLAGRESAAAGWQADLSQINHPSSPRLTAKRTEPLPAVELRVVLDK